MKRKSLWHIRIDPDLWSIHRLCGRCVSDIYGESGPGIDIYRTVPGTPADRRQSDLSACSGQFGRPSVYLGAGCGKYRRKPDGYRWNVDLYSADVSVLCFVPGSCLH